VPLSDFQESLAEMASRITTAGTIATTAITAGTIATTAIKETPRREHAAGEHVRTLASEYFGIPEEQTKFDNNAASRM
jgi:DNA-binding ferritin-like protein